MRIIKLSDIINAHRHSKNNFQEIMNGRTVSCFYCFNTFQTKDLLYIENRYFLDYTTTFCPYCNTDSLLGEKCGYPADRDFLEAMGYIWFNSYADGHKHFYKQKNLIDNLNKRFKILEDVKVDGLNHPVFGDRLFFEEF